MASDSDCNQFMHKALYFEDTGDEFELFDLNLPPTSGEEYLRRVQLEARNCPDVVVANVDRKHFIGKQTVMFTEGKGCLPAPKGYAPSNYWQGMWISQFSGVRQNLSRYRSELKRTKNQSATASPSLPDICDDVGWCKFCFGNKLQHDLANRNKSFKSHDTQEEEEEVDNLTLGTPPLLSIVTNMTQPIIEQVLDYHSNWFEATGFTVELGQWFYALLACLEKPLTPEACSSIRTIARQCANLRASLVKDDPILSHLNLLICLISKYFDQGDLAD